MSKRGKRLIIGLMIIVGVSLWLQTPLMAATRGLAWNSWVGMVGKIWQIGPLTIPNNVSEQMRSLVAENAKLKAECHDYQTIIKQIGSVDWAGFKQVQARVAAQPIDTFHAQLVLNRGARDGLILGAPAVIQGSVVVGFIDQLYDRTAILQLLVSPKTNFPGEVLAGEKTGKGLVKGRSFTSVEMVTIPRDVVIKPGQEVITAAQEGIVPHGLLVGRISERQDEQYEPYQRARLIIPYDTAELKAVTVLIAP